mmetsp:Transcript_130806/g.378437  ORF Transcript_130806/g.378437 Transcript_130806/m.378437 type:complete len:211 (-) Transcript_130806:1024-1656(-)
MRDGCADRPRRLGARHLLRAIHDLWLCALVHPLRAGDGRRQGRVLRGQRADAHDARRHGQGPLFDPMALGALPSGVSVGVDIGAHLPPLVGCECCEVAEHAYLQGAHGRGAESRVRHLHQVVVCVRVVRGLVPWHSCPCSVDIGICRRTGRCEGGLLVRAGRHPNTTGDRRGRAHLRGHRCSGERLAGSAASCSGVSLLLDHPPLGHVRY